MKTLDVGAWERSVDVNVKGFIYSLAAALPIMREGGGGHVICLDAEDPGSPDPLYRAGQEAQRVILRELARELSDWGIRTTGVRLGDARRMGPDRCAEAVRRVLLDPPGTDAGFSIQEVS